MNTVKRLLMYMKYYKGYFAIGIGLVILSTITDLGAPIIAQRVIDNVITPAAQEGEAVTDTLIELIAIYFGLMVSTVILRYVSSIYRMRAANGVIKVLRDQLYTHVQELPINYFDKQPAGSIVARITNDTESLRQQFYVATVGQILINVFYIIGAYLAIAFFHQGLALTLLILIPVMYLWNKYYTKYARVFHRKERDLNSDINGKLNESIQGMQIVQAFGQEEKIQGEFEEINEKWYDVMRKYVILDSAFQWTFADFLRRFSLLLLMVYFSTQYINGVLGISVGMLYLFGDYVSRLYEPIKGTIQQIAFVQQAIAAGDRVFELMDMDAEDNPAESLEVSEGRVAFSNVHFSYTEDKEVLSDIDFTAEPGETVALVGHTGSGKSSIMNLLFRFYDPQTGKITIDGQDTKTYSRQSVRHDMGIVLQDPFLFTGTIYTNITMDNPSISRETATQALIDVGGEDLLEKFEKGIDEPVVEKGSTLSSGQRQLISFARALAFNPKILILDEATSSIDTETEEIIQHAMNVLKEGRTTFIIAHRLSTIQHADQILVLDQGQIIERGRHDELLSERGAYSEMYEMQKKGQIIPA
ncbi:ABC transporter ATP-binding protein [Alkalibacterium putridalgicola]|uniref:ATP-binding cassette, subfamily B, tetracycline resistant protein n=1 Tax=Alkalibacterium putridalgicola TaxID=426703 RepID=A0A1H7QJB4_9LACT|nr:ABC transporter ATP-binding protein [Alkalibacterium putridalgicola]GEK88468.1 putative multidrug resistance ABC transporter ATP-binding/permease protein YheH [Alkalibacterium putridalgicola]SEL47367.1 ATP-binding cassette, subfamily B, tetracycline resistant protein [Alkalibacterium putridalgicola]